MWQPLVLLACAALCAAATDTGTTGATPDLAWLDSLPCKPEVMSIVYDVSKYSACVEASGTNRTRAEETCASALEDVVGSLGLYVEKDECRVALGQFVQKNFVDVDIGGVVDIIVAAHNCSLMGKSMKECVSEARQAIDISENELWTQLAQGAPTDGANAVRLTLGAFREFQECSHSSKSMREVFGLDENGWLDYRGKVARVLEAFREDEAAMAAQDPALQMFFQLYELLMGEPLTISRLANKVDPDTIGDLRVCKKEWANLEAHLVAMMATPRTLDAARAILNRMPMMQPAQFWSQAFLNDSTHPSEYRLATVLGRLECLYTWGDVRELDTCSDGAALQLTSYANYLKTQAALLRAQSINPSTSENPIEWGVIAVVGGVVAAGLLFASGLAGVVYLWWRKRKQSKQMEQLVLDTEQFYEDEDDDPLQL
eukprot:comp12558_c0_seq1/m.7559 comp12558_c0_seq1/g.7559  ORF comp12558_c0_seq1/g.7559 comp12558_c0_seq1/m.7559 type:complete len:429 (-) comp12558_c0_seq1:71-1357(-)